jgi:hypothetical protein
VTLVEVFVSRPAVLTSDQETLYHQWLDGLAALGFAPVTIPRADYAAPPWRQLRQAVTRASGALVLGFRQVIVDGGCRRSEPSEQTAAVGSYATAWNQLEAGLAVMARLPVLVVPEDDVKEGAFAPEVWGNGVYGARMDVWTAGDGTRDQSIRAWAMAVSGDAPMPATPDRSAPFDCELPTNAEAIQRRVLGTADG